MYIERMVVALTDALMALREARVRGPQPPPPKAPSDVSVDELELPTRVREVLRDRNVFTLGDLKASHEDWHDYGLSKDDQGLVIDEIWRLSSCQKGTCCERPYGHDGDCQP